MTLQLAQINGSGTQQTDLFIGGDDQFNGRMGNGLVRQQCHTHSHSNAVVGTQGGTLGKDHPAVMHNNQSVHSHIQRAVGVLFTDHIHMTLENHRRMVFHALAGLSEEDHIVVLVLDVLQIILLCKLHQIVGDHLGIPGAVRDSTDLLKITEYSGRLQARQSLGFHSIRSFKSV